MMYESSSGTTAEQDRARRGSHRLLLTFYELIEQTLAEYVDYMVCTPRRRSSLYVIIRYVFVNMKLSQSDHIKSEPLHSFNSPVLGNPGCL